MSTKDNFEIIEEKVLEICDCGDICEKTKSLNLGRVRVFCIY